MAREQYQPQEVVNAEVVEVRVKSETNAQRRNFNYVVRLNTVDPESGESLMVNEYRTLASDTPLGTDTVLERMIQLIESGLAE